MRPFFFIITAATLALACQSPAAPTASSGTPTPGLINEPPSKQAPTAKAGAVHGGEVAIAASTSRTLTTTLPADREKMPNDAIHAAYRKSSTHAGGQLPSGHPPVPGARAPHAPKAAAGETGVQLPLPLEGPGSVDELTRRLTTVSDAAAKATLEKAFRLTFTLERAKRDPAQAATLLAPLTDDAISGATASRILGYVAVSRGFDFEGAMKHYNDAVKKDPDYGEAHYALAFMHVRGDKVMGLDHFKRAHALGVPDTRGIARFYPDAATPTAKQPVDPPR